MGKKPLGKSWILGRGFSKSNKHITVGNFGNPSKISEIIACHVRHMR
jgi:hypothetical protein